MQLNIGKVIQAKRLEKGITQQTLADFLDISKASVSKWETGQSYPDLTLLPLLAAYFDLSVDALLDYDAQLSAEQIQHLYTSLKEDFAVKSGAEMLTAIRNLVHRYYSCYPLLMEMGVLILNHHDLLPGQNAAEKTEIYLNEAKELFVRVRQGATDPKLINKATNFEAYCLLILKQPDAVLSTLGEYTPEYFPSESLIAWAYQEKQDLPRAIATTQSSLYQYTIVMLNQFTNYLQLLIADPPKFTETYRRGSALVDIFKMQRYHPLLVLNFQMSALIGFVQLKDQARVEQLLADYIHLLSQTQFPVSLRGDHYFDQVADWLAQTDLGPQSARETQQMQQDFVDVIFQNPLLQSIIHDPHYSALIEQLQQLKEQSTHA